MLSKYFLITAALVIALTASAWATDPSLTLIDVAGAGTDVSGDGLVVTGNAGYYGPCFTWTELGGVVYIDGYGGFVTTSFDGSNVSANLEDGGMEYAGYWLGGTNWQNLGGIGGSSGNSVSTNYDISGDGLTVVGLAWVDAGTAHAFQWTDGTGMVDLGSLGGESSRANAISGDGTTVVGWDQDPNTGWWRGAKWVNGVEELLDPAGACGDAHGVNHDGSIIVGGGHPDYYDHAYMWNATDGFVDLGVLSGWNYMADGYDVSNDGRVVVGYSGAFMDEHAAIWTEATGLVRLADYLADLGVTVPTDWTLKFANAVSDDGTVIVGYAQDLMWNQKPFVAVIPPIDPLAEIVANGETETLNVNYGDNVVIDVSLDPSFVEGSNADWWLFASTPFGIHHYNLSNGWVPGLMTTFRGPAVPLSNKEVFNGAGLPVGAYFFYFGIDMEMGNGVMDLDKAYWDTVTVFVQ